MLLVNTAPVPRVCHRTKHSLLGGLPWNSSIISIIKLPLKSGVCQPFARSLPARPNADILPARQESVQRPSYYDNGVNGAEEPVLDGGNGGSDGTNIKYTGGNGGGGGSHEGPPGDDEGSPNLFWYLKAFFSMLVTVAMYILLGKMAASKHEDAARQRLQANGLHSNTEASLLQPESLRSDIQTLKRLQRDVFEQLYTINRRSTQNAGKAERSDGTRWTAFLRSTWLSLPLDWPPRSHSGDRVGLGDPSRELFGLDKQSEALDFRIRGESWSEDKRLGLLIECALPDLDGQTSHDVLAPQSTARLARAVATWKVKDGLKLVLPFVSGRGDDVVVSLNPQAGLGMTDCLRSGCKSHQQCEGRGLGAIFSRGNLGLSILDLFQGSHAAPSLSDRSTLLQVAGSVNEDIMLGCHFLRKAPRFRTSASSDDSSASPEDSEEYLQTLHKLGATGALNIGNRRTLSAWCSVLPTNGLACESLEAGITFGTLPIPGKNGWAVAAGRYNGDSSESTSTGYTAEAMMRVFPDEKVMLAPSLLLLNGEGRPSLRLGLQTHWQF